MWSGRGLVRMQDGGYSTGRVKGTVIRNLEEYGRAKVHFRGKYVLHKGHGIAQRLPAHHIIEFQPSRGYSIMASLRIGMDFIRRLQANAVCPITLTA
jgi:hypothetical protein